MTPVDLSFGKTRVKEQLTGEGIIGPGTGTPRASEAFDGTHLFNPRCLVDLHRESFAAVGE
jgi:hypothetical protein